MNKKKICLVVAVIFAVSIAAIALVESAEATVTGPLSGDAELLARLISAEARGEPYSGQVAVGAVVLNRMKHPSFPNTLSGVIYQTGAFSCIRDGSFNQPIANSAYQAAVDALNGADPSGGAVNYYSLSSPVSMELRSRPIIITIGKHVFCS